jgi:DUF971 family protein
MSAPRPQAILPVQIRKEADDRLVIDWSDGHQSVYTWKQLRDNCPCATCREEKVKPVDPFHILTAAELAPKAPLAPTAMTPVGYYAYKITWNDGHDTGIYTLENLRALCQCPQCQATRSV